MVAFDIVQHIEHAQAHAIACACVLIALYLQARGDSQTSALETSRRCYQEPYFTSGQRLLMGWASHGLLDQTSGWAFMQATAQSIRAC